MTARAIPIALAGAAGVSAWLSLGAVAVTLFALCSCCLWAGREQPRFDHSFDIGEGRTIRVWSTARGNVWDFDPDPNPLMVNYRIERGETELAHKTFLDHDDGGELPVRGAAGRGRAAGLRL